MASGTKYNTKQELLDAIQELVYENDNNETSSENIQQAAKDIVESLWDNANPLKSSDVAYVNSTYGNDSTGAVGVLNKKYKTINAANASSANSIIIEEGTYIENQVFKGSKSYYCYFNTIIISTNINEDGFSGKIYGFGQFVIADNNFNLFKNLDSCYIEFCSIISSTTKALITANDNAKIILIGQGTGQYTIKASVSLGYEGIFGYPSTGTNISIYSTNIFYNTNINSTSICPFNRPNLDFRFYNCILKSTGTNGNIFGRYSANATNIKMILNNCYLISSFTTASVDIIGAYQYTYIDNNTYSNKALDSNTQAYQGTVIVDTDIVNLY